MKCTPELLEQIKRLIEATPYGSVEITLSEKGTFIEIVKTEKFRYEKPDKGIS
jgi:hypothetical protein